MRHALVIISTGIVSGLAGAILVGHFAAPPPAPQPPPASVALPARPAIIPPGWDPRLVDRVINLERQLTVPQTRTPTPAESPSAADSDDAQRRVAGREQERLEHYQRELEYRERKLVELSQEAIDSSWAHTQAQSMQQFLSHSVVGQSAEIKDVDCRSKNCAVTLSFPSPGEALATLQKDTGDLTVASCKGFSVIPTPPTDDGPYELTIFYNCR